MSDYAHRPGGKLKLKGDDGAKKKKKKSHGKDERRDKEAEVAVAERSERREEREARDKAKGKEAEAEKPAASGRRLTAAEARFEEVQRKRREDKAKRSAHQTHKDRVNELNSKLDRLSEHHDMPRIGPG